MSIIFHNPGEIDIRGACIAGLNAKQDETAIGFFGTGLKYGIASILRWQGDITIWSGTTKHEFTLEALDFRGKDFQQIVMTSTTSDGVCTRTQLGFTTEYGKKWEAWQVFRELYSNAKDEGGTVYASGDEFGMPGFTTIVVQCPEVEALFSMRDEIILPEGLLTSISEDFAIKDKPSKFLYFKNVRVLDRQTICTYNLNSGAELTEDRTLQSTWHYSYRLTQHLLALTDTEVLYKILSAPSGTYESTLDWDHFTHDPSDQWLNMAELIFKSNPKALNASAREMLLKHRKNLAEAPLFQPTKMQSKMLERAKQLVKLMDMPVDNYVIELRDLGKNVLGKFEDGKIILGRGVFEQGTKQVVSTLYEEMLHATTGLMDCTYEMQTTLFNKIVSLYEEHVFGEPC